MECIVKEPISRNGVRIEPGERVTLEGDEFERMHALGCVVSVAEHEARTEADQKIAVIHEEATTKARAVEKAHAVTSKAERGPRKPTSTSGHGGE